MAPLFLYLLKSSISLAILVIFYEAFQKREAFFNFNRAYFLMGIGIVLLLPFLNFNFFSFVLPAANSYEYMLTYQVSGYQLSEVTIRDGGTEQTGLSAITLLLFIYLGGVILRTVLFVARTFQLLSLVKNARAAINDRIRIIFTDGDLPIFSFFNNIFITESTFYSHDAGHIIAHEKIHISQLHSLDLLFAEMVCIVLWFNPFAYILKKEIKENHEYIADQQVISQYTDASKYRLLLLKYSSRVSTNSLAHNFSYSLLKRRLDMIKKPKKRMRLGLSITAASMAFILVLFACSQPDQNKIETSGAKDISLTEDVYENVEVMPKYPGGNENLVAFLRSNIKYPEKAKKDGTKGIVDVSFIVEKDGSLSYAKVTKGLSTECDLEALKVINSMPDWIPGKQQGEVVRVGLELPIIFSLEYGSKKADNTAETDNTDTTFTVVKQMPEFPGGMQALMNYLGANIKYPEQAKRDSIQGRVFVQFVVEKDGAVSGAKVLRGIGGGCDEEALRVVSSMPNWKPGLDENNEPVRVEYNIPIKYALK